MDRGVVIETLKNNKFLVRITLKEECSHCQAKDSCQTDEKKDIRDIVVFSNMGLAIGDLVDIVIRPKVRIFTSMLFFLLPILSVFAFYNLSKKFLGNEDLSILLGVVGIPIAFLVAYLITKNIKFFNKYIPEGKKVD